MKAIVFDTGPLISLTLNNLLWLLEELKKRFKGNFYISKSIRNELVERPLKTKKFEFEALQALHYIEKGVIEVIDNEEIKKKTLELLDLANNSFRAKGNFIRIAHYGEISGIAACLYLNSDIFVVDERTIRLLIENPNKLKNILEHRLHTKIAINGNNLKKFRALTKNIKLIRSIELVTIAYELGLLNKYILNIPNSKKILLESLLWGVKLDGCSVSKKEIEQIIRLEKV